MIPTDTANHRDMRMIVMVLRHTIDGRSEVFIAFHDHVFRGFRKAHHHVEAFQLCPDHEIRLNAHMFQHMQDHRSDGRFSVATTDDDARLILALLIKIFGIGIDLQPKFLDTN